MSPKPVPLDRAAWPLTGGVDTKVHGVVLPPPRLQECINAYVDQTGSIQRRFGRSALTSSTSTGGSIGDFFVAHGLHQTRLLGVTSVLTNKLWEYGETDARWVDKGSVSAAQRIYTRKISAGDVTVTGGSKDMAILNNYRCYAFETYEFDGTNWITRVLFSLTDDNGTRYATNQQLTSATAAGALASSVRVVAFGTRFYIVYWDVNTAATLKTFLIDTTSAATIASSLAGAAVSTATDLEPYLATYGVLDLEVNATNGPFIAYRTTAASPNQIAHGFISTTGTFVNTSTVDTGVGTDPITISVAVAPGNVSHAIVYTHGTITTDVYAVLKTFSGGVWATTATSAAVDNALAAALTRGVACIWDSSSVLRIYYDADINTTYPCIRQGTFTTGGTLNRRVARLNRSYLASRPFLGADNVQYIWVVNEPFSKSNTQPTMFMMSKDGVLAGLVNQGIAHLPAMQPYALGHVPHDTDATKYSVFTDYYTEVPTTTAAQEVIVDFDYDDSLRMVEDGQCTYIPGGVLQQYDGQGCTEVGFSQFVDTQRLNLGAARITNGAGSLTNAANTIYAWRIVYEWTNAQGEREQSTDNGPKANLAADWAAGDDTVDLVIDCLPWTLKQGARTDVTIAIYRTLANPTDTSPHFRVGTIQNDPALDTVTFVDTMSDATAATQPQLYADTEIDNTGPPPGSIITSGNGRVFLAGLPEDPSKVIYTKTRGHGEALNFSDILEIQFPSADGPITALAVFNESLIAFTETAIYRVNGPGVANDGAQGGFTEPVRIQSDVGALRQRGVVVTPMGVMFESGKGKVLLRANFTVEDVGLPLAKLADPGACTGACLIPDLQQVRFSYAATTHVYDYYHQQWYVFTHGSAGPTCVWTDKHTAADVTAVYDDTAVFTDAGDPYAVTLTLGWMHASSSLFSDLTVRHIALTGEALAQSYLTIYVSQDQVVTPTQTIEGQFTAAKPIKVKFRVKKQLCSLIEITIRDAVLDVYLADVVFNTAGWRLNELAFELGLRTPRLGRTAAGGALAPR